MQKQFDSILDFVGLRDRCLFCDRPLRVSLTNYLNPRENGLLPMLDSDLFENNKFFFRIKHTTENYDIKADGTLDIVNNILSFKEALGSHTPAIDQYMAQQAFTGMQPYIALSCNNYSCKNRYSLSSYSLSVMESYPNVPAHQWIISPLKLFLESFRVGHLIVQNNWISQTTHIHSFINENTVPLKVPFMDFESMDKEKLLTRVKTLVTFS